MTQHAPAETKYDLAVIGAGSGGLACARRAAGHGARVLLVERAELGGTCVNRGCVPKKLMWEAGRILSEARDLAARGIAPASGSPDLGRLATGIADKLATIRDSYERKLSDEGVTLLRGTARLEGPGRIVVDGTAFDAGRIVIATGGRPARLDVPGVDLMATSDDVFGWRAVPRRLLVIGGGYVGCEFASIFAAMGTDARIVNDTDALLDGFDPDGVGHCTDLLRQRGIDVTCGTTVERVERDGDDLVVRLSDGTTDRVSHVLCAVGRTPNIDGLGPVADGLARAESGALAVSERLETSIPGIHAIGDVADRLPLTPVATRDGETLADLLFGEGGELIDLDLVSSATFLYPPMAQVGRTVDRLDREGTPYSVFDGSTAPLPEGTVIPDREVPGAYGKILHGEDGRILGATLVGHAAADEIAWLAAGTASGATTGTLADATAVHPTLAEEVVGRR